MLPEVLRKLILQFRDHLLVGELLNQFYDRIARVGATTSERYSNCLPNQLRHFGMLEVSLTNFLLMESGYFHRVVEILGYDENIALRAWEIHGREVTAVIKQDFIVSRTVVLREMLDNILDRDEPYCEHLSQLITFVLQNILDL